MEKIPLIEGWQTQSDGVDRFFIEHIFYKRVIPAGLIRSEFHPIHRRGVRRTGWFLIPRCQTQSDGVDSVSKPIRFSKPYRFMKSHHHIKGIFYKRIIPLALNHKNEPLFFSPRRGEVFFAFPAGKDGMGLIEMSHSFQRTRILKDLFYQSA